MGLSEITNVVASWAEGQPLVLRAWLFGSRVRGNCRVDSDIDVAVEVDTLPGDTEPFASFAFEGDLLKTSLEALLPMAVDLQWYGGQSETPRIHAGLQESSILVYEAK
jgi:predicted nucleotidyltransferase